MVLRMKKEGQTAERWRDNITVTELIPHQLAMAAEAEDVFKKSDDSVKDYNVKDD